MPALRELQAASRAMLVGTRRSGGAPDRAGRARGRGATRDLPPPRADHADGGARGDLPVVCRLVDRRFFAYAADPYIRAHPPAGPCLFEYGATFPDFLAAFRRAGTSPICPTSRGSNGR